MNNKVYIEILNEGVTYDCENNVEDVIRAIEEEYERFDVCIGEILNGIAIHGLSVPDVVTVYAYLYSKYENDKVLHIFFEDDEDISKAMDLSII